MSSVKLFLSLTVIHWLFSRTPVFTDTYLSFNDCLQLFIQQDQLLDPFKMSSDNNLLAQEEITTSQLGHVTVTTTTKNVPKLITNKSVVLPALQFWPILFTALSGLDLWNIWHSSQRFVTFSMQQRWWSWIINKLFFGWQDQQNIPSFWCAGDMCVS